MPTRKTRLSRLSDGVWGKGTSKALQRKLGVKADGKFGKNSMKALQRYLNSR